MARITTTITAEFDPSSIDEQGEYEIRFDADVTLTEDFPQDVDPKDFVVQSVSGFLSRLVEQEVLLDTDDTDEEYPIPGDSATVGEEENR